MRRSSYYALTHWGRVTHVCVCELTTIAWTAPSYYPNQCRAIVNRAHRNKLRWNFNRNSNIFIQEKSISKCRLGNGGHLSRPPCVNINAWLRVCDVSTLQGRFLACDFTSKSFRSTSVSHCNRKLSTSTILKDSVIFTSTAVATGYRLAPKATSKSLTNVREIIDQIWLGIEHNSWYKIHRSRYKA